jgi:hypothetical protein
LGRLRSDPEQAQTRDLLIRLDRHQTWAHRVRLFDHLVEVRTRDAVTIFSDQLRLAPGGRRAFSSGTTSGVCSGVWTIAGRSALAGVRGFVALF